MSRSKAPLILPGAALLAVILSTGASPSPQVVVKEGTNVKVTLSPDRKTILMDLQEALWTLPFKGGMAKRLTDPFLEPAKPDWSPQGGLVAFQSFKGGTFHIWVMKPDGSGVRQLTDGHGDDRDPAFSPDGKKVAFSSDRGFKGNYDIWVAEVETGKLAQWTSAPADEFEPAWFPDGSGIAYVSGTGAIGTTIESIDAYGERRTIVRAPSGAHVNSPSWSPDGKKLAYTQFSGRTTRLMVAGKTVGTAEDVVPFAPVWLSHDQLLYTGDGKILVSTLGGETQTIAFSAAFTLNRPTYTRRQVDFDSAVERPVKGIIDPALSPDGTRIVFEALNQLWLADQSGMARPLTGDSFYKQSPAWSPDGAQIAYVSDQSGTANIYLPNLATNSGRQLTRQHDNAALRPVWSPDGAKIAFQNQAGATYIADVATGEVKEALAQRYEPGRPSWSAKGKALSLAVLRPYSRRYREGTNLIETVNLATGKSTLTEPAPYKSISTRGSDGPIYSPDGSQMAFVMDGYLWKRPVDEYGIPSGEARPINEEMTDSPSWSGDGKQILYLSYGKLRMVAADGATPPRDVPLDLTWHRESPPAGTIVIHAGRLWNGLGPGERMDLDVTIAGRRIRSIQPHRQSLHSGATVIDASGMTLMPGFWESHNHGYGGLPSFGDRAGRIWLAYGFTDLQSQGDNAYGQMEVKESFASGRRVGPRYFATGEPIDGERGYYAGDHGATNDTELKLELERARALEYDNLKTYVRLPQELQQKAMDFAHHTLGIWTASHYGLPGFGYGMDGITHVSATSRWGYSYTRSFGGVSYDDVRSLFAVPGAFVISTPFAAAALYAEDPKILDDPRIATLNTPWQQKTMLGNRDRAVAASGSADGNVQLENLRAEEDTLNAVRRAGGTVVMGTDSPLPGLAILNHLGLRAEVKFGMQPWEALQTVTLLPAKAFGYAKDLGSIEAGKLADLVIVSGDPLHDIRDAANVQTVIVGGKIYSIGDLMAPYGAR